MAHFAEIDSNNIVTRVLVVPNEEELRGQEFLANDLGLGGRWIQTSYNRKIRKNYAGIGYSYNEELDMFLPPKIYDSWVLDQSLGQCVAPIDIPNDPNYIYVWNEDNLRWDPTPIPVVDNLN
jgi:hypothetical protein